MILGSGIKIRNHNMTLKLSKCLHSFLWSINGVKLIWVVAGTHRAPSIDPLDRTTVVADLLPTRACLKLKEKSEIVLVALDPLKDAPHRNRLPCHQLAMSNKLVAPWVM